LDPDPPAGEVDPGQELQRSNLVVVQLHDLHPFVFRVVADELHARELELLHQVGVDLVAMPVTLLDAVLKKVGTEILIILGQML
jgi:hypothetical protein